MEKIDRSVDRVDRKRQMNCNEVVLAIDAGTSSVRVARFDLTGQRIARSLLRGSYTLHIDHRGKAVFDSANWLETTVDSIRQAMRANVRAIGMSCFWHSLLGVDAEGKALTPIYTWADSRCREEAAALA